MKIYKTTSEQRTTGTQLTYAVLLTFNSILLDEGHSTDILFLHFRDLSEITYKKVRLNKILMEEPLIKFKSGKLAINGPIIVAVIPAGIVKYARSIHVKEMNFGKANPIRTMSTLMHSSKSI